MCSATTPVSSVGFMMAPLVRQAFGPGTRAVRRTP
jgi:hypothetical protein